MKKILKILILIILFMLLLNSHCFAIKNDSTLEKIETSKKIESLQLNGNHLHKKNISYLPDYTYILALPKFNL